MKTVVKVLKHSDIANKRLVPINSSIEKALLWLKSTNTISELTNIL